MFPTLCNLLDLHPKKLGGIIKTAYDHTFPEVKSNNVNQLAVRFSVFSKDRQYYIDHYRVWLLIEQTPVWGINLSANEIQGEKLHQKELLSGLFFSITKTLSILNSSQENEHRTLEHICYALVPVYYSYGLVGLGFNLFEYADQWRRLTDEDRQKLMSELIDRLK